MKIEIKNLKVNQVIYDEDPTDHYRVFAEPEFKDGKWQVEVTTSVYYVKKSGANIFNQWVVLEKDTFKSCINK